MAGRIISSCVIGRVSRRRLTSRLPVAVRVVDGVFRTLRRFAGSAGEVVYAELDGLRIARHDEGAGPSVIFFHGDPTWS